MTEARFSRQLQTSVAPREHTLKLLSHGLEKDRCLSVCRRASEGLKGLTPEKIDRTLIVPKARSRERARERRVFGSKSLCLLCAQLVSPPRIAEAKFDESEQGHACIISLGLLSKSSLDIVYGKEDYTKRQSHSA